MTEKDWKRAQAGVETDDGYLRIENRNKNMISGKNQVRFYIRATIRCFDEIPAFLSVVRLFPEPITNQKMVSMNAVYVDGFRRKKQFIVAEVPDESNVGLFWCMIKQNQIEQVIVLNEPSTDEIVFVPEQSEQLIYTGISVTHLREYFLKNRKIMSCGLGDVCLLVLLI